MILLRSDCLEFEMSTGEIIPCSAELVAIEMIGAAATSIEPDIIQEAAAAVLHYFKEEQGRSHVTVNEFCAALEAVLRGFGLSVQPAEDGRPAPRVLETDLSFLACESGKGFELTFFTSLRDELLQKLRECPDVLRFKGLRRCVKQIVGARRWSGRCQQLNDQIVEYLRLVWSTRREAASCALVVE